MPLGSPFTRFRGDYLFGNETEAQAYAEAVGWDTQVRGQWTRDGLGGGDW